MKKQANFFLIILVIYVFLQFIWWGNLLIRLNGQLAISSQDYQRRVWMVIGEGSVFIVLLFLGIWKMRKVILKEIGLTQRQSNFLLSVTHELKTPISSVKLFLQTLLKHELPEEKKTDLLKKAMEENERLSLLIDNILHASRVENKSLKAVNSVIQLNSLVKSIVDRFHKRYLQEFITVQSSESIDLYADAFILEMIIVNLLENACKYAGIDAQISIYLHKQDTCFVLGVKDEGPGIPTHERSSIFDKFYRIGNEETRQKQGSGLGLFIASEFAQLQGAKITCKENFPKGTVFEVTLPYDKSLRTHHT
jgi:two-component system phosphate regulon sensor histidine kinase PhoR